MALVLLPIVLLVGESCSWGYAATLLARVVLTRSLDGDTIERTRRRSPRMPAELVRRVLPPLDPGSFVTGIVGELEDQTAVVCSGWPCSRWGSGRCRRRRRWSSTSPLSRAA
jgi:hypothetical protein